MRKFSVMLLFLSLTPNLDAKLSFSNIQGQKDFLNTLLNEIEKSSSTKNFKKGSGDKNNDIEKYKADINSLQKTLFCIETENAKEQTDKKVLQELVEAYNKKMKELENTYKEIMLKKQKINKARDTEQYLKTKTTGTCISDTLNYEGKRRRIRDTKFRPLEIVEISQNSESTNKTPLQSAE